jgi:DNA-binding transcriptional regulator YdaS (Cro superfamily)
MAEKIPQLLEYLNSLSTSDQHAFATRCESTPGHIRNVAHGYSPCAEKLAINLERETAREVRCEKLRPDVDWAFIRGTRRRRKVAKKT